MPRQYESSAKKRAAAIDELNDVINPDEEGGSLISGMTKRVGFSDGRQVSVENMPQKAARRKGRI